MKRRKSLFESHNVWYGFWSDWTIIIIIIEGNPFRIFNRIISMTLTLIELYFLFCSVLQIPILQADNDNRIWKTGTIVSLFGTFGMSISFESRKSIFFRFFRNVLISLNSIECVSRNEQQETVCILLIIRIHLKYFATLWLLKNWSLILVEHFKFAFRRLLCILRSAFFYILLRSDFFYVNLLTLFTFCICMWTTVRSNVHISFHFFSSRKHNRNGITNGIRNIPNSLICREDRIEYPLQI